MENAALNFSVVNSVADTVVGLVGDVVGMMTANPILLLGIGIGLFYGAIRVVRSFI